MADVEELAWRLWTEAHEHEQSAARVPDDAQAAEIRARVREFAKHAGVRIRTSRMNDDVVAVVRLDAAIWTDDTATMRSKLSHLIS